MTDMVRLPRIPFTVTVYDYRGGDWLADPANLVGAEHAQEHLFAALIEMQADAAVFWDRDVGQLPEGTRTITVALWDPESKHCQGHHGAVVCSDGMWDHLGAWTFTGDLRWKVVSTVGLSLPTLLLPPPISTQLPYPFRDRLVDAATSGPVASDDPGLDFDPIDNEYDLT